MGRTSLQCHGIVVPVEMISMGSAPHRPPRNCVVVNGFFPTIPPVLISPL